MSFFLYKTNKLKMSETQSTYQYQYEYDFEQNNTDNEEIKELSGRIKKLESIIDTIIRENISLRNDVNNLKSSYADLQCRRNEMYYQRFLEKYMSAKHKKTMYGITDITTVDHHIEIKHWRHYKTALGQLLSYNHNDNKNLATYFFGSFPDEQKSSVIELFRSKNISIYEFIDAFDGIRILPILDMTQTNRESQNDKDNQFIDWLSERIEKSDGESMCLDEICFVFDSDSITSSTDKTKYKHLIENFIKTKFSRGNWRCGFIGNTKIRGWENFSFYNIDDPFIKWLDTHIEYKENSVLKLNVICEQYLGQTNLHTNILSKYKKPIENWIKMNYKDVKNLHGCIKSNNKTYKGWKNLCLKNNL